MQLSPWEANSCLGCQEIPRNVCNAKVQYSVHNSPPLVRILSQMNLVYTVSSCFFRSILILSYHTYAQDSSNFSFTSASLLSSMHDVHLILHKQSISDHPSSVQQLLQIIKPLITEFSLSSCHFLHLGSRGSPHYPLPWKTIPHLSAHD